jgi:hypothetical protein
LPSLLSFWWNAPAGPRDSRRSRSWQEFLFNRPVTSRRPGGVIAIIAAIFGAIDAPTMPVAMIPTPSVLNQTSMMTLPSGVSAIVEATGGMIGVATVLVAMTPMPWVLMPTASPQQTLWDPTLAVVVDG